MTSRRVLIVVVLCSLGAMLWLWLGGSGDREAEAPMAVSMPVEPVGPVDPSTQGGIEPRRVDSAKHGSFFVAPDADPRAVVAAAGGSEELFGLVLAEYEAFADLDDWSHVGGKDDDFRRKIAACQVKFEGSLQGDCTWDHDLVLRSTGGNQGEVVGVAVRNADVEPDAACKAMSECFSRAWMGRAGPLPRGWDEPLFSFTSVGSPSTQPAVQGSIEERIEYYEAALAQARELLSEAEAARSQAPTLPPGRPDSSRHNAELYAAMVRHLEALLEALKEGKGG